MHAEVCNKRNQRRKKKKGKCANHSSTPPQRNRQNSDVNKMSRRLMMAHSLILPVLLKVLSTLQQVNVQNQPFRYLASLLNGEIMVQSLITKWFLLAGDQGTPLKSFYDPLLRSYV